MRRPSGGSALGIAGAFGLLISTYFAWYEPGSAEDFFDRYYGTNPGGLREPIHVDLWWFHVPSALLLTLGVLSLFVALARLVGPAPDPLWLDRTAVVVGLLTPALTAFLIAFPPGPDELYEPVYGAFIGLACSVLICVSLLPRRSQSADSVLGQWRRPGLAHCLTWLGSAALVAMFFAPWWRADDTIRFVHHYFHGGGSDAVASVTVSLWWFPWQSIILLLGAVAASTVALLRLSPQPISIGPLALLVAATQAAAVALVLLIAPSSAGPFTLQTSAAWGAIAATAVTMAGLLLPYALTATRAPNTNATQDT